MNREPRPENPYLEMSEEELTYNLRELQAIQDELSNEFNLIQKAIVTKNIERFSR